MESVKKTFRIPKLTLDKWLAALRSGEYQQGENAMYNPNSNTYCCLGVLQKVCDGKVDTDHAVPTRAWATAHGIESLSIVWRTFNPALGSVRAAESNDSGMPFPKIADLLEKYAETY